MSRARDGVDLSRVRPLTPLGRVALMGWAITWLVIVAMFWVEEP